MSEYLITNNIITNNPNYSEKNATSTPNKTIQKMAKHLETGVLGEAAAVQYLRDAGYEILETNCQRCKQ